MKLTTRLAAVIVVIAGTISSTFANQTYKIDPAHSTIAFKVHQYLTTVTGKFTRFSGRIEVDPDHPEESFVNARIDAKSIDTGIARRDAHLCSAEFFNAAKFPEITFRSRSVKRTGENTGDITGDFIMHGVTKTIVLHAKLVGDAKIAADARRTRWQVTTAPLNRREFGLLFSGGAEAVSGIGQEVTVDLDIEAVREP
jgi:polyisoprenoid-binding protein YceI